MAFFGAARETVVVFASTAVLAVGVSAAAAKVVFDNDKLAAQGAPGASALADGSGLIGGEVQNATPYLQVAQAVSKADEERLLKELQAIMSEFEKLDSQGRHSETEPLMRRRAEIAKELRGADHVDVVQALSDLATNLLVQNKRDEAEEVERQALAMLDRLGAGADPIYAGNLLALAAILTPGRLEEAEQYARQALAINEQALGEEHPETLRSMYYVGNALLAQKRYVEAEESFRQLLDVAERVLGSGDSLTQRTKKRLAQVLTILGKEAPAELSQQMKDVASKSDARLDARLKEAMDIDNKALDLEKQERFEEAEPLYRQSLEIYEKVMGADHTATAAALWRLADNLSTQERDEEAEPLYRRSLKIVEDYLGPEHQATASGLDKLAVNLYWQGRFDEADPLYRRAIEIYERIRGKENPKTVSVVLNLALNLDRQRRFTEAEKLYREALDIHQRYLGAEHPRTQEIAKFLAENLQAQGKTE